MKKLSFILPVMALMACGSSYKEYDSVFVGCERIETTEEHLVYKCPADQEWAVAVKTLEPNGMFKFKTGADLNLSELYADKDYVYAEVAFNDPGMCKEDFTIRTMIAEPNSDKYWAFIGCK